MIWSRRGLKQARPWPRDVPRCKTGARFAGDKNSGRGGEVHLDGRKDQHTSTRTVMSQRSTTEKNEGSKFEMSLRLRR